MRQPFFSAKKVNTHSDSQIADMYKNVGIAKLAVFCREVVNCIVSTIEIVKNSRFEYGVRSVYVMCPFVRGSTVLALYPVILSFSCPKTLCIDEIEAWVHVYIYIRGLPLYFC